MIYSKKDTNECFICNISTKSIESKWCKTCNKYFCQDCATEKKRCPQCGSLGRQQQEAPKKEISPITLSTVFIGAIFLLLLALSGKSEKAKNITSKSNKKAKRLTKKVSSKKAKKITKPISQVRKKSSSRSKRQRQTLSNTATYVKNPEKIPFINEKLSLPYFEAQLAKEEKQKLAPAVVVLPFTCPKKYSGLGTFISLLGMFQAIYAPQKVMNLSFSHVQLYFKNQGFIHSNANFGEISRYRIQARFNAIAIATGNIEIQANKYHLTLNFYGKQKKIYKKSFFANGLVNAPGWVSNCIYNYLDINEDRTLWQKTKLHNEQQLLKAAKLYLEFLQSNYLKSPAEWQKISQENPHSIFLQMCHCVCMQAQLKLQYLPMIQQLCQKYPKHDYLHHLRATYLYTLRKYPESLQAFLKIFKRNYNNPQYYYDFSNLLKAVGSWSGMEILHQKWRNLDQDSYFPPLYSGEFYIQYGWHARGSGVAMKVSPKGWKLFKQRLKKAEKYLTQAYHTNPSDGRAAASMITVCMALGYPRKTMEKWFTRSIEANPNSLLTHDKKLNYLMPKWHGSLEEMFKFANDTIDRVSEDSKAALVLGYAHGELGKPYNVGKKYFERKDVWQDISDVYDRYFTHHPYDMKERNQYAYYALCAKNYKEAAKQFAYIEKQGGQIYLDRTFNVDARLDVAVYFHIADVHLAANEKSIAVKWLKRGLGLKASEYKYQIIYARLLIEQKDFKEAYQRLKSVISSNSSWQKQAQQLLDKLETFLKQKGKHHILMQQENVSLPDHTLYLLKIRGINEVILQGIKKEVEKTFGIKVQFIKASYLPLHRWQIRLGQYPQWDAVAMRKTLKKHYKNFIEAPKSLGVLAVTDRDIGSARYNFLYAWSSEKASVMSFYRFNTPGVSQKFLHKRVLTLAYTCVGKIIGIGGCTISTCSRAYVQNLNEHDRKTSILCSVCTGKLRAKYKEFRSIAKNSTSGKYNGFWNGRIATGGKIYFIIKNNRLIEVGCNVKGRSSKLTKPGGWEITGNTIKPYGYNITFVNANNAQGDLSYNKKVSNWKATKQK